MAGGRSRCDHSEVGSGYIHFNFTPWGARGDKATPSLFGDVTRGVFLREDRIFLGGSGGCVGPRSVGFGAVTGAGQVTRRDVPDHTMSVQPAPEMSREFVAGRLDRVQPRAGANARYLGQLAALRTERAGAGPSRRRRGTSPAARRLDTRTWRPNDSASPGFRGRAWCERGRAGRGGGPVRGRPPRSGEDRGDCPAVGRGREHRGRRHPWTGCSPGDGRRGRRHGVVEAVASAVGGRGDPLSRTRRTRRRHLERRGGGPKAVRPRAGGDGHQARQGAGQLEAAGVVHLGHEHHVGERAGCRRDSGARPRRRQPRRRPRRRRPPRSRLDPSAVAWASSASKPAVSTGTSRRHGRRRSPGRAGP